MPETRRKSSNRAPTNGTTLAMSTVEAPKQMTKKEKAVVAKRVVDEALLGANVAGSILRPFSRNQEAPDDPGANLAQPIVFELSKQLLEDLQPRSAVERMLVEQLLVTHSQMLAFHHRLVGAQDLESMDKLAVIASRFQGEFRKTMLALKELRAPSRQVIVAQHANVAHQQIVNQVTDQHLRSE